MLSETDGNSEECFVLTLFPWNEYTKTLLQTLWSIEILDHWTTGRHYIIWKSIKVPLLLLLLLLLIKTTTNLITKIIVIIIITINNFNENWGYSVNAQQQGCKNSTPLHMQKLNLVSVNEVATIQNTIFKNDKSVITLT